MRLSIQLYIGYNTFIVWACLNPVCCLVHNVTPQALQKAYEDGNDLKELVVMGSPVVDSTGEYFECFRSIDKPGV